MQLLGAHFIQIPSCAIIVFRRTFDPPDEIFGASLSFIRTEERMGEKEGEVIWFLVDFLFDFLSDLYLTVSLSHRKISEQVDLFLPPCVF